MRNLEDRERPTNESLASQFERSWEGISGLRVEVIKG
jgi:hypothetical protein